MTKPITDFRYKVIGQFRPVPKCKAQKCKGPIRIVLPFGYGLNFAASGTGQQPRPLIEPVANSIAPTVRRFETT